MADATPSMGTAPPRIGLSSANAIRTRLLNANRETVETKLGKGESWCRKVLDGSQGVMLEDIPGFLDALELKSVDKSKVCLNEEVARAQETMLRAAMQNRSLLFEDAE